MHPPAERSDGVPVHLGQAFDGTDLARSWAGDGMTNPPLVLYRG
jgi:hypothetical protein